jgi:hypothetical protein
MSQEPHLVQSIDHFEQVFGSLPEEKKKKVEVALHFLMEELRKVVEPEAPTGMACVTPGSRCGSCAFNTSIDSHNDFRSTAYNVLYSLMKGKKFGCHRNQHGWKDGIIDMNTLQVCKGYMTAIENDPDLVANITGLTVVWIDAITGRTTTL